MNSNEWHKRLERFDSIAEESMNDWKIPGMAVAIIKDGEIVLSKGYGFSNIKENRKVTENTVMGIASATKPFTATAIGILVDEGKLQWDTPVKNYTPWFKMYDSVATERITVRDMLCHRTGLPRHEFMWYNSPISRRELVERIQYLQPSRDFRSTFQYSNQMITVAGYLIEEITGKTWEQFVQEKIFDPMEMISSNFSVDKLQQMPDYSRPYIKAGEELKEIPFRKCELTGPAGSINSNIIDLAKWVLLNLNKGKYKDKTVISEAGMEQIHTPHMLMNGRMTKEIQFLSYGLCWSVESYRGHRNLWHNGAIDGFSSQVGFCPDENIGVVILTNRSSLSRLAMGMQYTIYDLLLGYEDRNWLKLLKQAEDEQMKQIDLIKSKNAEESNKTETKPPRPIEEYLGKYGHPGYGVMTVYTEDGRLKSELNGVTYTFKHVNYDAFKLTIDFFPEYVPDVPSVFQPDKNGDIGKLCIPFELDPAVKDIEFIKIS